MEGIFTNIICYTQWYFSHVCGLMVQCIMQKIVTVNNYAKLKIKVNGVNEPWQRLRE